MVDSALDTLGVEVTGIISPVSICMAITVWLVRTLNPEGQSNDRTVYIATAYYHEQEGDSTGTKLVGSLINALIFVAIIAVMTFVLVLLFKYGYTRFIYGYMAFAGFSIFFIMTGTISALLIQKLQWHLDYISFFFILTNFAVVGVLALFYMPVPITMKQGYLIVTGVITAYVFTWIPAWTTWMVLIAMSLYDLAAVLSPVGPLKMLVELAQERDEDIPALVYEGRPVGRSVAQSAQRMREAQNQASNEHVRLPLGVVGTMTTPSRDPLAHPSSSASPDSLSPGASNAPLDAVVVSSANATSAAGVVNGATSAITDLEPEIEEEEDVDEQTSLLGPTRALQGGPRRAQPQVNAGRSETGGPQEGPHGQIVEEEGDEDEFELSDAIKLGLGDFIFYSVLVARAAMHDLLTAITSYVAIIAGLGLTLLLLGLYQKALPALPISIALGCCFYFVTVAVMEPCAASMIGGLLFL